LPEAFDFIDFAAVALELAKSSDEARKRTAIGRAYYAAYHVARRYVQQEKRVTVPKSGEAHKEVQDALKTGSKEEAGAGSRLAELHKKRKHADYRIHDCQVGRDLPYSISAARHVVTALGPRVKIAWPAQDADDAS
jgi:hypothetical protein